jgi:hypothetical protein
VQQRAGVKSFVAKPLGRILLGALATVTLVGSFLFLGPLLGIVTFLFFGLAIPIYLGWKQPRYLAVMGLAVLLVAAPIASAWEAQMLRVPSPSANSNPNAPYGNGGAVLQGSGVTPYTGGSGGAYNFTITVHPEFVPTNTSGLQWIELIVTTCPGATGNSSPFCASGYPFYLWNQTLPANVTGPRLVSFVETLPGSNLWWYQFATAYYTGNGSSKNLTWIFLNPGNGYGSVQGPVSGDYLSTVGLVIPALYADMLLYPGLVFFVALLIYYVWKRREATRKAAAAGASAPEGPTGAAPTSPAPPGPPTSGTAESTRAPTGPGERRCPNCSAVVYPTESSCWKCGTKLTSGKDTPLPSGLPP